METDGEMMCIINMTLNELSKWSALQSVWSALIVPISHSSFINQYNIT